MLFSSFEFIFLFLPITLAGYFLLNRLRLAVAANAWLLFASLFFYGWWDIRYVPLIMGSILFNYTVGNLVIEEDAPRKRRVSRKAIFIVGIAANIGLLCWFKYMDFFIGNINAALGTELPLLKIILPLGISFFTITQIAFLVDAYWGLVKERALLNYALFVTFFPHLLAGPILHHKEMMPQFDRPRNKVPNYRNLSAGLFLFMIGMAKKLVVADTLAPVVDAGFLLPAQVTFLEAWVSSIGYTLQLYFDFSGYSDMAIGAGLMFNIMLPINFNSPYKAKSIIEFWQRWHVTLSRFINTYLYTPILRSFGLTTFNKSLAAIFIAMFISGVWHGAGWTFILWGSLHGLALVVNHWWRKKKIRMPPVLAWMVTFLFLNGSFVIFRAASLADALELLHGMIGLHGVILPKALHGVSFLADAGVRFGRIFPITNAKGGVALLLLALAAALLARNSLELADRRQFVPNRLRLSLLTILTLVNVLLLNSVRVREFLYFDF